MAAPTTEDIKVLEQTRQRIYQLTESLASLQRNITQSDPLPPWSSFQNQISIVSSNLSSLTSHLTTHSPLLTSLTVYPLPSFPATTQENVLFQLLRKKLEPSVEEWVSEGRALAIDTVGAHDVVKQNELNDLWTWAGEEAGRQGAKHPWFGNFTLEEIERGPENVVTGLRRKLKIDPEDDSEEEKEEEEEEEEGGDEKMPDAVKGQKAGGVEPAVAKPLPIEDMFRFMMTGAEPKR